MLQFGNDHVRQTGAPAARSTRGGVPGAPTKGGVNQLMSAFGTKRTSNCNPAMSAFGGKADITATKRNFNLRLPRKLWQLGDVRRDLPRLIA
jgi:hypothetical protein